MIDPSNSAADAFAQYRDERAQIPEAERDMFIDDFGDRTDRFDFKVAIEAGARRVNSEKEKIKRTRAAGDAVPVGEPGYRAPPPGLYSSPFSDLGKYPDRVVLASTFPYRYNYSLLSSPRRALDYLMQRSPAATAAFFFIEKARPVMAYFDAERPVSAQPTLLGGPEQFVSACRLAVALFCCYVDTVLGYHTNRSYESEWHFYTACTASKYSLHMHSSLTFNSVKELGSLVIRFVELLSELNERGDAMVAPLFYVDAKSGKQRSIIDAGVYTARPFRLPMCEKEQGAGNFLMPLAADEQRRGADGKLSTEQHLARGFIHPAPSIQPYANLHPPPPPDPAELRKCMLHQLTNVPCWPVADQCELDKAIRDAIVTCQKIIPRLSSLTIPLPTDEQLLDDDFFAEASWQLIQPAVVNALYDASILRRPMTSNHNSMPVPSETTAAVIARRERFLAAAAALLCILLQATDWNGEASAVAPLTDRLRFVVQSSFEMALETTNREQRVSQLAKGTFGIEMVDATPPLLDSISDIPSSSDLFREFAFCSFYLRSLVYYEHVYKKRQWPTGSTTTTTTTAALNTSEQQQQQHHHHQQRQRRRVSLNKTTTFNDSSESIRTASVHESAALHWFLINSPATPIKVNMCLEKYEDDNYRTALLDGNRIIRERYAAFERLAPRLFSIPDCLITLSQIARIAERDPLSMPAIKPVAPLAASIAAALPALQSRSASGGSPAWMRSAPAAHGMILSRSGSGSYSPALMQSGSTGGSCSPLSRSCSSSPAIVSGPVVIPMVLAVLISGLEELQFGSEADEYTFFYSKK